MGLPESISSWNLIYLSLGFLWTISLIVFRVWPFFWCWLSFIYSSMLIILVVVSIYIIIVSLELVLLKIWRELVAFMWRVMGGAILQLIVLSVFLIALRCRNICLVSVDTTVWSFWKFVKSDMIVLSLDMYQVFMFHADIHRWMVSFRAMLILIRILDIILRLSF